ncbi:MAG: nucleotidyltransferase domain-containing protein [Proteobacteria bacterium]|nr:nucleotidyltransferase domain-containing protein [Pseudomonadota bacterium]
MKEQDRLMVLEIKKRIPHELQQHLRKLIIFGSRARGEGKEDSDLDVLALVDEKTPEIENVLDRAAYSTMWDYDFKPIVSLKVLSESHFYEAARRGFSFYRYVEQEGITV